MSPASTIALVVMNRRSRDFASEAYPLLHSHQRKRGNHAEHQEAGQDAKRRAHSELNHGLDPRRDVCQECDSVAEESHEQGGEYRAESRHEGGPRTVAAAALFPIAADPVNREIDAKGNHRYRYHQTQDQVVLESDKVGEPLQPDDHCRQRSSDDCHRPVGVKGDPHDNQDRKDGESDERSRHTALLAAGQVRVDGDAPGAQVLLAAAQPRLDRACKLLPRRIVRSCHRALGARAKSLVVSQHVGNERRDNPMAGCGFLSALDG